MILVLPVLLLLAGAAMIGLLRRTSGFYLWVVALASIFLGWLSLLLNSGGQAGPIDLSVWRPEPLFSAELVLGLGTTQWSVVYAAMTLLMALVLTAPARDGKEHATDWAILLVYGAFSLLAMMAGNLLTLSLLLIMLDVGAFVFILPRAQADRSGQQAILKLGVESVGVLLLLTAGLVATLGQGGRDVSLREARAIDLVFALGVILRIGIAPLPLGLPAASAPRRGIGALMRLLPPAIIMLQVGNQWPAGVAAPLQGWIVVIGAITALAAGVAWAFKLVPLEARAQLVACAAGLALVATSTGANTAQGMSAIAVLMMFAGGMASVAEVHTPFHRIWPAMLAVTCLGLPLTPAGSFLRGFPTGGSGLLVAGVAGIGLGLLAAGVGLMTLMAGTPWMRSEGYSRLLFGVGLALFPIAAVGYGLRLGFDVSVTGAIGLGASLATAAIVIVVRRRRLEAGIRRVERIVGWLDAEPLLRGALRLYRDVLGIAGGVGYAIEGEGTFLWVMALAAVAAALLAGMSG